MAENNQNITVTPVKLGASVAQRTNDINQNFEILKNKANEHTESLITQSTTIAENTTAINNKLDSAPTNGKPLIVDGKISDEYIPDTLVGQLEYIGTWDASTTTNSYTTFQKGYYWVCSKDGVYNPDKSAYNGAYAVGDWAIYNGANATEKWSKVDNTDAVTMVNGKIGSVYTYLGTWKTTDTYAVGDWVVYNDTLYLSLMPNNTGNNPATSSTYWKASGNTTTDVQTEDNNTTLTEGKILLGAGNRKVKVSGYTISSNSLDNSTEKIAVNSQVQAAIASSAAAINETIDLTKTALAGNISSVDAKVTQNANAINERKIKDLHVNGSTVVDSTGIANITVQDLSSEWIEVLGSACTPINVKENNSDVPYYAIEVGNYEEGTSFEVYKQVGENLEQIVSQGVVKNNKLYYLIGKDKQNDDVYYLRKISGSGISLGSSGTSGIKKYMHTAMIIANNGIQGSIHFISNRPTQYSLNGFDSFIVEYLTEITNAQIETKDTTKNIEFGDGDLTDIRGELIVDDGYEFDGIAELILHATTRDLYSNIEEAANGIWYTAPYLSGQKKITGISITFDGTDFFINIGSGNTTYVFESLDIIYTTSKEVTNKVNIWHPFSGANSTTTYIALSYDTDNKKLYAISNTNTKQEITIIAVYDYVKPL